MFKITRKITRAAPKTDVHLAKDVGRLPSYLGHRTRVAPLGPKEPCRPARQEATGPPATRPSHETQLVDRAVASARTERSEGGRPR